MKIAILGPVYSKTYFGGVATFNENIAYAMKKKGHDVKIMVTQKDALDRTSRGVEISRLTYNNLRKHYDIVIASLKYIMYLPFINSDKKIYFLHGFYYMPEKGFFKTICALMFQKFFIRKCDYVISNSYFTSYINYHAYNINAVGSVSLGVSYDFLDALSNYDKSVVRQKKKLLYVGRLVKAKSVEKILESLQLLDRSYELTVVGDGEYRQFLEKYAKDNELNVNFVGKINQDQTIKYYLNSNVFISLNDAEPFGISYCEALIAGCKIISPNMGGQVEYLKKYPEQVRLVSVNAQDISKAIIQLCNVSTITNVNKEYFTYENTADQIFKLIDNGRKGHEYSCIN